MTAPSQSRIGEGPARAAGWLTAALLLWALCGAASAAPQDTLGPGDTVRVTVYQNPDLTTETRVSEQGAIVVPLIGQVQVGGLTPIDAGNRIAAELKGGNFIKAPQVNVTVLQIRSRQVAVLGSVARPGRYVLDDATTSLTDVLALAGGIAPGGDDTVTVITRRGGAEKTFQVNIAEMIRNGDLSANFEIRSGDLVYVQRAPTFYIYGEVQRAGAYRIEPGMVLMQALSLGGGLTPRGTERGIVVYRHGPNGAIRRLQGKLFEPVRPDDVIHVGESLF